MASRTARLLFTSYLQLVNPLRWKRVPREVSLYLKDLSRYRDLLRQRTPDMAVELYPILFERALNSPFDAHYTYQAAWATRIIVGLAPAQHVDVSSQVPFIAQLSAIIPVKMFEFHKPDIHLENLTLEEASVLSLPLPDQSLPSLSCLHVIEHVGLGRYGDPLDPAGTDKALVELARVVAPGGSFLLSVPVGRERVVFNAHRVSDAPGIVARAAELGLTLREFALVNDAGAFNPHAAPADAATLDYGCGMFWFQREAPGMVPTAVPTSKGGRA